MQQLIVIAGPTASGKTGLAIRLARKFNGEVISADSRQVYTGLDLGTGKVTKKETLGVPHHLLNVASPSRQFTAVQFQKLARKKLMEIWKRGRLPIICGGTGLYIDALVYNRQFPAVRPDPKLRRKLSKKSAAQLFKILKKMDPERAKTIDPQNPRRLVRALEILYATKKPITPLSEKSSAYAALWLGLNPAREKLRRNIHKRLLSRFRQGMIAEVKRLKERGVSSKRLEALGLEYRYINRYLERKMTREQLVKELEHAIWQYAKRQMTWFRRNSEIHWIARPENGIKIVRTFLPKYQKDPD